MERDTLLIVDDMEVNRAILRSLFEQEYDLLEAENGRQALLLIQQYRSSLAAVLMDVVMPVMDGYEVMAEMARSGLMTRIPVIVITSEDSMENEVRAFDLGAADIIIKPFEPHVVRRRVQNAAELNRHKMHLEEMVEEQAVKLRESRDVIMDTLSSVIEHRSLETGQHVLRIRMFTKVLLEDVMRCCPEYELTDRAIGVIAEAAALHDIGKISIPDTILNKPGPLTPGEIQVMRTHTVKGCEILSGLDRMGDREYLQNAYNICRYHHERWDGGGYPDGLKGDNIPICAQAVGVADAYDALTNDRVYKKAIPPEQAVTMILNGECGVFSPKLLECLKNVREQFFRLTREYADGSSPKPEGRHLPAALPSPRLGPKSLPELGQMKYLAMLRYLESTVMEVDLDSGIYHLVYQQNGDFQDLRSGSSFEESLRTFADRAVHPEDRHLVLEILETYIEDFFQKGLLKRSRSYRVFHRETGEYIRYEATALRVDLDNPNHRKALLIWKLPAGRCERPAPQEETGAPSVSSLPAGVLRCFNDRWFSIQYVNEGFLAMFGYSSEELQERFHGRYLEMIHPDDRADVYHRFLEQYSAGTAQDLEYRVPAKNGRTVWVLEKCLPAPEQACAESLHCVLTDITAVKQAQEEMRLTLERYRIVQDQADDIIFEGDLLTGDVSYSPNWEKKFGYPPLSHDVLNRVRTASHLFPEDVPRALGLIRDIRAGASYGETELRIATADGKYLWCRARMTAQFDAGGRPTKAVGVIQDIDAQKRRTQELADKAQQDPLTRLYNKDAARRKIERRLERREPTEPFALFLIDLDNFKQINDSHGHMFGDAVLAEAAFHLKKLFRSGDIVSRFGGDEFLVFLPFFAGEAFLLEKAEEIVEAFRSVYSDELHDFHLTCSVGVSRCPENGTDFQSLFQRCDQALYQAKLRGKDSAALYDAQTMSRTFLPDPDRALAAGTRIESDGAADFSVDSIVPEAFQKLYESEDVETAVYAILEMVGQRFNVSRAYIFENSEDGSSGINTFEWCAEGIPPQIENLRDVPFDSLGGNYYAHFDENDIFYCQDISVLPKKLYEMLAAQGIRSLLQCAVRDGGRPVGFVGFDDCTILRMWTQNQVDALTFISELLSSFLMKKRAQDRALTSARDLRTALDNQNSWIYVIGPDDYILRYVNAKTVRTVPGAKAGLPCFEAFFHRDAPCEQCPARDIRTVHNRTLEIYNPILKIWTLADASLISWGGKEACLLACHDITGYKEQGASPSPPPAPPEGTAPDGPQ